MGLSSDFVFAVGFLLVIAVCAIIFRSGRPGPAIAYTPAPAADPDQYCPACGIVGPSRFRRDGSGFVAFLLCLFLLVPGIIYIIWRHSTARWVCPSCGHAGMIPLNSPKAQAELNRATAAR